LKYFCLLPVRDEADIIAQCLQHLLAWADAIYVFDTGSVDDTWEIVQEAASRDRRVKPIQKEPVYFSETKLRGYMFDVARAELRTGDWFLRCDADEFHHVQPPEFVRTRLESHETIAYHQYYNFALTAAEAAAWEAGKEGIGDRARPIAERRRHYQVSTYAEPRLCRYRRTMQWPIWASFPVNAGFVARARLPIRHYPHRDPLQLQRRCRLRAVMMADARNRRNWGAPEQHHWAEEDWRKFITLDDALDLIHWKPGTALTEIHQYDHLAPWRTRLLQRLVHAVGLPLLDRLRPSFPAGARPQPITPEVQQRLVEALKALP